MRSRSPATLAMACWLAITSLPNADAAEWIPFGRPGVYPRGHSRFCTTVDTRRGHVLLINGSYHGFYHAPYVIPFYDTWFLTPGDGLWYPMVHPALGARSAAEWCAAVYDSVGDRAILFG